MAFEFASHGAVDPVKDPNERKVFVSSTQENHEVVGVYQRVGAYSVKLLNLDTTLTVNVIESKFLVKRADCDEL